MKLPKLTTAILLGIATLLLALGCETDSSSDDSSSSNDNPSPKLAITGTFRYDSLDINAQKDHSIQGNAVKWDDDAAANQLDNLEYSVAPPLPTGLTLNKATGKITGTPTNHIASKQYTVTAEGNDKDKFSGSIDTTLYITVVDDTKTLIKGTFAYPNADIIGATTVDMTANSQDPIPTWNDNVAGQTVRYTITPALPEGLSFVADTGAITGTSKNPVPKTQYKVTAIVGGTYGGTYTTSINITITEKFPITETGATLSYNAMLLKTNVDIDASKEGTPIWEKKPQGMNASYSIAPTSLPAGLNFDTATGAITGKSSVVSKQEYIITVTDTENLYQGSIESKVSIEVTDKPLKTAITGTFRYDSLDINAQKDHSIQGNAVKWDDDAATNQTDNLEYSIDPPLPTGLEINVTTGEITGTPTNHIASKQYTVTAKGDEKFSGSIDTTLYITVVDDTKTLIKGTFAYPNADIIGATTVDMTANSQDPIPTWNDNVAGQTVRYTITPALPEGLSFVADTGAITGTSKNPVPKTQYKVTAIVGGTYGGTYTTSINITITEKFPITETGATLSYNAILLKTNVDIDASKEGSPIWDKRPQGMNASYSIAPTPLPAGILFDPNTGAFIGKSSVVVSRQEYTITVTDTANFYQGSIESKVSIEVTDKPPITGNFTYNNQADVQIIKGTATATKTFDPTWESAAQDQLTNLQYSIAPSIPNVVTINASTGVISVTPTQALKKKDYTVTAKGIGNFGGNLTSVINIEIINPPITGTFTYQEIIFAKENTDGLTGAVPNWTDQAANQLDNLHYSVAPPLPAGLEINKDTGEISGTPTQASAKKPYIITATGINIFSGEQTFDIYITINAQIDGTLSYQAIIVKINTEINAFPQWTDRSDKDQKTSYVVDPTSPLPTGLLFDAITGEITGTSAILVDTVVTIIATGVAPYSGIVEATASIKFTASTITYSPIAEGTADISTPSFVAGGITAADGTFSIAASGTGTVIATAPSIDTDSGDITVTAATTAGTYMVTFTKTSDSTEEIAPFYVTTTPTSVADIETALEIGIGHFGLVADFNYIQTGALTSMYGILSKNFVDGRWTDAGKPYIENFNGDISKWDVSNVKTMASMFNGAVAFNGDISGWNVEKVTTMAIMFRDAVAFNGDISGWNVEKVNGMASMFRGAVAFNGDISGWNVDNVQFMHYMFNGASEFNRDISGWNVDKVQFMGNMFSGALKFNADISGWTVDNVKDMESMFNGASEFNRDINDWNVDNVTDMKNMFNGASRFNGDISGWTVDNVQNMTSMFKNATTFNQDIGGWTVDNVQDMESMFNGASEFNRDLSGWNVDNVTDMKNMFNGASKFNGDISGWTVDNVQNMTSMFKNATTFNQDISGWDMDKVANISHMFYDATAFDKDLDAWKEHFTLDATTKKAIATKADEQIPLNKTDTFTRSKLEADGNEPSWY